MVQNSVQSFTYTVYYEKIKLREEIQIENLIQILLDTAEESNNFSIILLRLILRAD